MNEDLPQVHDESERTPPLGMRVGARIAANLAPTNMAIRNHPWAASFVGAVLTALIVLVLKGPFDAASTLLGLFVGCRFVLWAVEKGVLPTGQSPPFP